MQIVKPGFWGLTSEGTIDIQDLKGTFASGDSLLFWDPTGSKYTRYYYYDKTYSRDESEMGPGWGDADQYRATLPISADTAFWFSTSNADGKKLVFSGKVVPGEQTIDCAQGMNMVAFPVPVKIDFSTVRIQGNATGSSLLFYDTETRQYKRVYYYADTYESMDADAANLGPGWADADQVRMNVEAQSCEGFWVYATQPITLKTQVNF